MDTSPLHPVTPSGTSASDGSANGASSREQKQPTKLIVLVRHGQSTFNVEGRLPGQLPGVLLTDEGWRQAHAAAVALAGMPLSAVVASPLERARDTAEILARGWNIAVRLDDRLKDTDVPRWAGQKLDDVAKNDPTWKAFLEHPDEPPDGAESLAAVQQRAVAVVEELRRDPATGGQIAVVAHADVVKLILAHYTGIPVHGVRYMHIANASLSALAFTGDEPPHLLAMNWTPAPGWLVPPFSRTAKQGAETAPSDSIVERSNVTSDAPPERERVP